MANLETSNIVMNKICIKNKSNTSINPLVMRVKLPNTDGVKYFSSSNCT